MIFSIDRLRKLYEQLELICRKSGRNLQDITVLAATKYAEVEQINQIIGAGVQVIGENKIQDAQKKIPHLLPVKKHFIGTLQSNKVKTAVVLFDLIEAVDSLSLADKINTEAQKHEKIMPLLVEVNIAQDPKKHGIQPKLVFEFLKELKKYDHVRIEGLMAIVPYFVDSQEARPYFRMMKVLFDFCRHDFPQMHILSMGMSHDFIVALEEGATEIRIGSYLFRP